MKKTLILFNCMLLAAVAVKAQKPETAQVIVHYKFSHLRDTTKPADIYKENMILFLGPNSSAYKSYDRKMADALTKKQVQEQMAAGGEIRITRGPNSGSSTEYYQFPANNKLVRKEKLINNYLIEEPMPKIDWKITGDTATFGGLHCQKATTHFKGRDYTAWFCPDLPFHAGPWKLSGLPGVIVEASDAKNEVSFKFDGVEDVSKMPKAEPVAATAPPQGDGGRPQIKLIGIDDDSNADPNVIQLPEGAIKASEKEFTALRDAMRKDPNAFARSAMAGNGPMIGPGPGGPGGPGGGPTIDIRMTGGPVINNPLELPEKK